MIMCDHAVVVVLIGEDHHHIKIKQQQSEFALHVKHFDRIAHTHTVIKEMSSLIKLELKVIIVEREGKRRMTCANLRFWLNGLCSCCS